MMDAVTKISDRVFEELVELKGMVSPQVAAATALGMLDGAVRGYRAITADHLPDDEIITDLMGALGAKRAQLVALMII